MTSPYRTPKTVWISDDLNSPLMSGDGPKRGHWGSVQSQVFRHGPYVHLDQFLEEAKKRARKLNRFLPDVMEIMIKEIKERKS